MKTLIVILGPTGVGKTELCLRVAEYFHIPVINADSRQIYRGIPIGTATPTQEQQARVKHEMVEMLDIGEYYNASMFENDVLTLLEEHFKTHDLALMSGGSMMYIDAVCDGMGDLPTVSDEERTEMKRRYAEEGLEALCEELRQLDPEYYEIVDKKNYRRVIHALEIIHTTGSTFTSLRTGEKKERPFNIVKIGLNRDRNELYDRINKRVDAMMRDGLLDEAKRWYPQRDFQSLNTVGYKELFSYFDGQWSLEEAVERIKGNTRRYCRKQLTWFKRDDSIRWFNLSDTNPSDGSSSSDYNIKEIIKYITEVI
ncbi:MAG: tRNA (adenosine(37)-N6)-dimethylallyltransferase MiaA [Prevotella sp.]|nr:tRNA (adenosine(37)-N6)-dimethylallyltransferase MiaA [Prevotella sp.]